MKIKVTDVKYAVYEHPQEMEGAEPSEFIFEVDDSFDPENLYELIEEKMDHGVDGFAYEYV